MNSKVQQNVWKQSSRTILITGSSGKTNCMELIRQILVKAGYTVSCFGRVEDLNGGFERTDFVLVHAAFQELNRVTFSPDMVVIMNISSYPLSGYRRYRDLLEDLQSFIGGLARGTAAVENYDYQFLRNMLGEVNDSLDRFSFRAKGALNEGVWVSPSGEIMLSDSRFGAEPVLIASLDHLLLQGERNLGIYLAAIAAAERYADPSVIREACIKFSGHPAHFCCYQLERNRRLYMQLNTGLPSLAEAAFVGFSEKLVIVTGRFEETESDQSYQGLALMLSAYAKRLILFGPDSEVIKYAVRKIGVKKSYDLSIIIVKTADEAVRYAADTARDGEWILFSPIDHMTGLRFDRGKMSFMTEKKEM